MITQRQLRVLRECSRLSEELSLRHQARNAAQHTQIDYIRRMEGKLDKIPQHRRELRNVPPLTIEANPHLQPGSLTRLSAEQEQRIGKASAELDAEEERLRTEIPLARAELGQLRDHVAEISIYSSPLNSLLPRVLEAAGLSAADAGLPFETHREAMAPARIVVGGA